MLKALKRELLGVAKRVRLLECVAGTGWRRQRLLILGYHSFSVDQEHLWRRPLFFTVQEFEHRLQLLQSWQMNVLSLSEGLDGLRRGTLPPRSAVLTFDDGMADFHGIVWPLLRHYGYPATVYVTTYYSEKRQPIFPLMCSYLLWKGRDRVIPAVPELGVKEAATLSSDGQRAIVARAIVAHAEREACTAEEKNGQAARLAQALQIDYDDLLRRRVLQLMTADEIQQVAAEGANVQLHTHRHRAPRRRDLFDQEIDDNRMRLEPLTRLPTEHFCYPSGVTFPEFLPWLAAQHVKSATTCVPGFATAHSSPLLLPRVIDTASLTPLEFEGWLTGLSAFLPRRTGMGPA